MYINVYEFNLFRLSYSIYLPAPSPLWIFAKFQGFCRQQLPFVRHTELEGRCHGHNTYAACHGEASMVTSPKTDQTWAFSKQSGLLVFYI